MSLRSRCLALCLAVGGVLPTAPARADGPPPPGNGGGPPPTSAATETARREAIERLERSLRKAAASPRAAKLREEIEKDLAALGFDDEAVEKRVLALAEAYHDKSLVKPLADLVEHKDTRRRFRLHAALARTLAVIGDASAIEPLTTMVGSEDPTVVAAAADALGTFKQVPHAKRVEPVRRMIDRFESCWNLKESRRPEDRVAGEQARAEWEVYGAALRRALQLLTGQTHLTKPRQFRDWWNDHKKATDW